MIIRTNPTLTRAGLLRSAAPQWACSAVTTVLAVLLFTAAASAAPFSYLDPGYTQQIYTGPLISGQEAGMAWTSSNNLLTRAGSTIIEHSLTQNTVYQGTNLNGVTMVHPITGLSSSGYGMTNGKDGYIYVATGSGLERFKPSNWAAPAQSLAGTVGGPGWGITTLMDGRIAYSDSSNIYVYNPVGGTNSLIYTSAPGVQVDDIEASTTGQIALSGHNNNTITIISTSGAPIITFPTPHAPDGLAFGDGAASNALFSNNNNGSITKYTLTPSYTSLLSAVDIATNLYTGGSTGGAYGDLAAVGPDCAFYVTQYENGGSNGSTPGVGTHWDNGITTNEPSIIRIAALGIGSDGLPGEVCGFASTTETVPEPSTMALLIVGVLGLVSCTWRKHTNKMVSALLALTLPSAEAYAAQYPVLDPGYTQEIYTGPMQNTEGGMAWTSSGNLLTRWGSNIVEYNLTQNLVHQGTNVHGATATHAIAGLPSSGVGMTNGLDGYVYTITGSGLYRFNPSNWAAPAVYLTGTTYGAQGYGITTLPDGRIAYTDSANTSSVWVYTPNANPTLGTNTLIYTAPANYLIDGMVAGPTGAIALAGQTNSSITIISNTGSLIQSFATPHFPDGMAFGGNPTTGTLYSNNNDGTISKYVLGLGYTNTPVITDIATGSGAYGDLAAVGPDCAFYVSQYAHPIAGYHGSTFGVGTNWNLGTNTEASIIRIGSLTGSDGTANAVCEFYSPLESVPEPSTMALLCTCLLGLASYIWRKRRI